MKSTADWLERLTPILEWNSWAFWSCVVRVSDYNPGIEFMNFFNRWDLSVWLCLRCYPGMEFMHFFTGRTLKLVRACNCYPGMKFKNFLNGWDRLTDILDWNSRASSMNEIYSWRVRASDCYPGMKFKELFQLMRFTADWLERLTAILV